MQDFLEYVIKNLVDHPEAIAISPADRNGVTVYQLRVDSRDVAKVIGRQGTTINSIRSLLVVGSARKGTRCTVEIVEDQPAKTEPPPPAE